MGASLGESYRVLGASEKLYKVCAKPADYHITDEARNNDQVERLEDGEELGKPIDADNVWHKSTSIHQFIPFVQRPAQDWEKLIIVTFN